jgi:spore photoproduct lyase
MTATHLETKWQNPANAIRKVFVEKGCLDATYTQEILQRLGDVSLEILEAGSTADIMQVHDAKAFSRGKKILFLTRNKGRFVKSCPGTKEYICCGYQVLNVGMNCPMDCVYCILQAYLNNPWMSFFVNLDDMFHELDTCMDADRNKLWRIGTGEFTDSLAMDHLTGLSRLLIEYIKTKPNAVLELKTKSVEIDNLLNIEHGGQAIISWSMNSPTVSQREELHAAPLEERIAAAARCAAHGFRVGFHFDPIIRHKNWQEGYTSIIEKIFASVAPQSIAWISLGCLRFLPALRKITAERFPGSRIFSEEFVIGLDNKFRYFRSVRVEMYRFILDKILSVSPECCVYLCMESAEIWQDVFGFVPDEHGGLSAMLDRAAFDK